MTADQSTWQDLSGIQRGILGIALIAAIVGAVVLFADTARFMQIYFIGFLFWTETAIACLGFVMLNNLVNGRWFYPVQRFLEAGARTLPLMAVLFIPIVLGLDDIYIHWAVPEADLYGGKALFLDPTFFVIRTFVYFAIWSALAYWLTGQSYRRDEVDDDPDYEGRMRGWSAVGLVIFVLTTTFAAFDWTMSIEPEWFSSGYGFLTMTRFALTMMALLIIVLALYWDREPLKDVVNQMVINDLGALLLTTLLAWVYINGTQLIITWAGNVTYYTVWYEIHLQGTWSGYITFIAGMHAILLLLLMIPGIKGRRDFLVGLAVFALVLRFFDLHWIIMPHYHTNTSLLPWDVVGVLFIGGLWLATAAWFLNRHALLPKFHPSLADGHQPEGAHA